MPTVAYYACCAIISLLYAILCLPGCHVMPTMSYESCSTYYGTLCLLLLCLFSITSLLYVIICLLRCNAIPTIIYYAAVPTVGYCAIKANYAYCAIVSYSAYCDMLCLLRCHNKSTLCYTMSTMPY